MISPVIIKEVILDYQKLDFPRELIQRDLSPQILEKKATILTGVRRCGKSTLLDFFIRENFDQKKQNLLKIHFSDDRLSGMNVTDFNELLKVYQAEFEKEGMPTLFVFDEIHRIKGWELFIDRLIRNSNHQVILTGSSSKMYSTDIATEMRGRSLRQEVFPYSFNEVIKANGLKPKEIFSTQNQTKLKKIFIQHLKSGGFPETYLQPIGHQISIWQEYFDVMLTKDLGERLEGVNLPLLRHLCLLLFNQTGSLMTVNKTLEKMRSVGFKVSKDFISQVISLLNDSYLLFQVPFFSESIHKRNTNPKKIYCIDNGLYHSVSKSILDQTAKQLENFVFLELRRRSKFPYYYKTKSGFEVDFIVDETNLIQVCLSLESDETRQREIRALREAMSELGLKKSVIVTLEENETVKVNEGKIEIISAPLWALNKSISI